MFEKVVMATDLSDDWDAIIACAGEFKTLGCRRVVLTHVLVAKGLVGTDTAALAEARPRLEAQKARLEDQGFEVEVETPVGLPAYSLNEVALKHCASLIVVGSHGKSAWREAILGSVASALLHHARFPILLINVKNFQSGGLESSCQLRATELLRHVLFPTDFSSVAGGAVDYVEYLASRGLSRVTVLQALEIEEATPPAFLEWAESAARGSMDALEKRLHAAGISEVNAQVSHGHPISLALDLVEKQDISLIVLGAQGKSLLSEIFLGSVAYNISRLAPCPVLLIPPAA